MGAVAQAGGIVFRPAGGRNGGVSVLAVGALEFDWRSKRYRVEYFLIRARSETNKTDGRKKVWLPYDEALARLTYEDTRRLLRDARPRMIDGP